MTKNEIPVQVSVKTTINGADPMELIVFGRYYQKEKAVYLQYEEVLEEVGTVRTTVKVSKEDMLILRTGAIKMRLPFRLQETLKGSYELPLGAFETTTTARKMDYTDHGNNSGRIEIVYDFEMQGSPAGTFHLEILFHPDHSDE